VQHIHLQSILYKRFILLIIVATQYHDKYCHSHFILINMHAPLNNKFLLIECVLEYCCFGLDVYVNVCAQQKHANQEVSYLLEKC